MVRLGGWSRHRSSPTPRALEGRGLQEAWRPPSPLLIYWIFPIVLSVPSVCCSLIKAHTLGHTRHRLFLCPGSLDLECHMQSPRERHWRKMKRKPPANTEVSFPNHRSLQVSNPEETTRRSKEAWSGKKWISKAGIQPETLSRTSSLGARKTEMPEIYMAIHTLNKQFPDVQQKIATKTPKPSSSKLSSNSLNHILSSKCPPACWHVIKKKKKKNRPVETHSSCFICAM